MGKDKRGTGDSMRHKLKITEHSDNHRKRWLALRKLKTKIIEQVDYRIMTQYLKERKKEKRLSSLAIICLN
jgi:hypothetical protein